MRTFLALLPRIVPGAAAVLLIAAAAAGLPLAADEPPDPDLATEGLRRAGPFYLRPFILLKDVGYDDNVRFDSREAEGDTTATAGAGIRGVALWGDRGGVNFSHELDYVAFGENTDLNHLNSFTRARGIALFKRLALSLEDAYSSVRERPNTEVDQRLRRRSNDLRAEVRSLRDRRFGWKAGLRHTDINYSTDVPGSEPAARRLSRVERSATLGGEARIRPKTTFTLEGIVEHVEFDDRSEGRDTRSYTILPGLRFDPSASIQGHLKIGVESLEAPERPQSDLRTTVGEAALSVRLGRASRLKGTFNRDLLFSILQENLYYVSRSWSAAYEQFFSRRLSAEIAYGTGRNHYPIEVTRGGEDPFRGIRDDRMTRYLTAIRYRIAHELSLVVSASRLIRDSTDDFYDRERTFYSFGTTYSF